MIEVEFNDTQIARAFRMLEMSLVDTAPVMNEIGQALLHSTQDRFKAGLTPEGTEFTPRSPVTLGRYKKLKQKYRSTPLWRGGDMYRTIHMFYDDESAAIGSAAIQSAVMQFGAKKAERPNLWGDIPARPFLGLSDEDRGNVVEIVREWLWNSALDTVEGTRSLY